MIFSIVIPTFNRKNIVFDCLRHLADQTFPKKDFEVIIVDDGSKEKLHSGIKKFKKETKLNVKYYYSKHVGPTITRNIGLRKAKGKYIALINDDMLPDKHWLEEHIKIHNKEKGVAVLGFIDWDPKIEINNFMRFIAPYGPQFDFRIKDWNNCGYKNFLTSNLTLERKWLEVENFNEDIKYASCEDIDLGIRLEKRGIRVVYNPKAIVYHSHVQQEKSFLRKMFIVGRDLNLINRKFPEAFRPSFFEMVKLIISRFYLLIFFDKNLYWRFKCGFFYYLGFFSDMHNKNFLYKAAYLVLKLSYELQEAFEKFFGFEKLELTPLMRQYR